MSGLIHIYCGDGKGKTTAAVGLAVQAAGAGQKVLFAQFLKTDMSSEIPVLRGLDGVRVRHCATVRGWVRDMTEPQRTQAAGDYNGFLAELFREAEAYDLLVLDEVITACGAGFIQPAALARLLETKPEGLEVVLTGRDPDPALTELADYITEMRKKKHPFDRGIRARKGIEF
jgi:cob(I)alamin adenosyltransferase